MCRRLPPHVSQVLPDDDVELLPKDEGGYDEGSRLSLEEQKAAWKEEATAAEEQARDRPRPAPLGTF